MTRSQCPAAQFICQASASPKTAAGPCTAADVAHSVEYNEFEGMNEIGERVLMQFLEIHSSTRELVYIGPWYLKLLAERISAPRCGICRAKVIGLEWELRDLR